MPQVGPKISEEEFNSGECFLRKSNGRLIDKKRKAAAEGVKARYVRQTYTSHSNVVRWVEWLLSPLLAGARKPAPGKFRVPFKRDKAAREATRTTPLHNPYAPGAVVLYNPPGGLASGYVNELKQIEPALVGSACS